MNVDIHNLGMFYRMLDIVYWGKKKKKEMWSKSVIEIDTVYMSTDPTAWKEANGTFCGFLTIYMPRYIIVNVSFNRVATVR